MNSSVMRINPPAFRAQGRGVSTGVILDRPPYPHNETTPIAAAVGGGILFCIFFFMRDFAPRQIRPQAARRSGGQTGSARFGGAGRRRACGRPCPTGGRLPTASPAPTIQWTAGAVSFIFVSLLRCRLPYSSSPRSAGRCGPAAPPHGK